MRSAGPACRTPSIQLDASDTGGAGAGRRSMAGGSICPACCEDPRAAARPARCAPDLEDRRRPRAGAAPKVSVKVGPASFANRRCQGRAERDLAHRPRHRRRARRPLSRASSSSTAGSPTRAAARLRRYLPLGLPDGVAQLPRPRRAGRHHQQRDLPRSRRPRGLSLPRSRRLARDAEFHIAAKVDGLTFAYAPPDAAAPAPSAGDAETWPPLTAGVGRDRRRPHRARAARRARRGSSTSTGPACRAGSPRWAARAGSTSTARGRGTLAEMLRFVETTPVGRWTGRALAAATGDRPGRAEARPGRAAGAPSPRRPSRARSRSPATTCA